MVRFKIYFSLLKPTLLFAWETLLPLLPLLPLLLVKILTIPY